MIAALAASADSTQKSLQAWGAYLIRLHSEPVSPKQGSLKSPAPQTETLKVPDAVSLSYATTLHTATCRCSVCSGIGLGTSGSGMTGSAAVEVNLSGELSEEDLRTIDKLKQRDTEVRRHEQSHMAAAGQHAIGGPSYTFQVGPDGRRYAIGGEVQIDLSSVPGDPEATFRKAQQLRQAALAPAAPSSTDRQVAMMASRMAQAALAEVAEQHSNPEAKEEGRPAENVETAGAHDTSTNSNGAVTTSDSNMQIRKTDSTEDIAYATLAESGPQAETPAALASTAQTALDTETGLDVYA